MLCQNYANIKISLENGAHNKYEYICMSLLNHYGNWQVSLAAQKHANMPRSPKNRIVRDNHSVFIHTYILRTYIGGDRYCDNNTIRATAILLYIYVTCKKKYLQRLTP